MDRGTLSALFRAKVYDRAEEVDADQERDWFDLAYGFALALDVEPEEAYEWASQARYSEGIA